jgi:TRAP-type C4-dicarboxylate transport system permease small subunit
MNWWKRVLDGLLDGSAVLSGMLLLFILTSISYGILSRALGMYSPVWIVQFNEYALLWMTFTGAAWVLKRGKHVSVDVILGRLRPKGRWLMSVTHNLLGSMVCGVLLYFTMRMTVSTFIRGVVDVKAVDVPKSLILTAIPLGFLMLTLQFLRSLIETLRRRPGRSIQT